MLFEMNNELTRSALADILVVDDTPDNIRFLSLILSDQGYSVRKAINGQMALVAVETLLPDLILLDISMPGMDGYAVCRQLKADPRTESIPVIFLSALGDVIDKVKAFQSGAVDYITKPFQFEEVLARIETQLTIRNLQLQLKQRNTELQQVLDDLTTAQAQLIQKEKMVGLGQLVAGLAHEINNPISFISGNITPANRYVQELVDLILLYQSEVPNPGAKVEQAIANLDLEFLITDLEKLFGSIKTGVERIRSIVLALRIFSRLDEADVKSVDLHQGIDSALLLLRHRLNTAGRRPEITIERQYSELPPVTCYASQLNQVFLNLLTNAIEALEARFEANEDDPEPLLIKITTALPDAETVMIKIQDNGPGIPLAFQSRVFNPFFTTKAVGKGAGLGLSTSYQIVVERHGGQLTFVSEPGRGCEFILQVPIALPQAA